MGLNEGSEADLEECLKVFKGKAHERRKAQALLVLGQVLEARGKKADSIERLSHALAQFEACKDSNGAAYARNRLGQGLLQWGQMETAASLVREALAHYEKTDNPSGMAWSRMLLGQMAVHEAQYDEAKKNFREGLEGYLTVGNRDGVSWSMNMMGQVAKLRGDYGGAEQMFLEALNIEDEISNHAAQAWTHTNLSEAEWFLGRSDQAEVHIHRAFEIYERLEDKGGMASALRWMGNMAISRGEVQEAERLFLEAEKETKAFPDPLAIAWHHYHMALVDQKRGATKDAEQKIALALHGFKKSRHLLGLGWGYLLAAELALQTGNLAGAKESLCESLRVARDLHVPPITLEGWLVWASLLAKENNLMEALEWSEAVVQYPKCSKPTVHQAMSLREAWEFQLDAESRAYARRGAAAADLDVWTNRILNKEIKPKSHAKPKPARKIK
jgi:tetratricopeptide (TPR) repeat protein